VTTCGVIRFQVRKARLVSVVARPAPAFDSNEDIEGDGPTVSPLPVSSARRQLYRSAEIPPTVLAARPLGSR